jgi:GntR family transcriptional regulator
MSQSFEEHHQARLVYMRANRAPPLPPVSRRAYELVRTGIRTGSVVPGSRLDEEYLSAIFGLSRNAVRAALVMLSEEGLVHRGRKVGTHVVRPLVAFDLRTGEAAGAGLFERRVAPSDSLVRELLAGDPVFAADSTALTECVLLQGESPVAWRAVVLGAGVPFERCVRVETVAADPAIASVLGIAEGAPVLVRAYVDLEESGQIAAFGYLVARGDRAVLRSASSADAADAAVGLSASA